MVKILNNVLVAAICVFKMGFYVLILHAIFYVLNYLSYLCPKYKTTVTMKKLSYAFIALAIIVFAVYFISSKQSNEAPQAPIRLSWQMIQNEVRPGVCESQLTIHNLTADTLQANWTLYYCQMSLAPLTIENEQIHVNQICASYHSVAPTAQYEPIPPHESRTYTLNHRGNVMRKSNAPEGAYIILDQQKPISVELERITSNDAHEFQRNIYYFPYADGEWMYEQNSRFTVSPLHGGTEGGLLHLLPTPKEYTLTGGTCDIAKAKLTTHHSPLTTHAEAYSLTITPDSVIILAVDAAGEFYARQTIEQLRVKYNGVVPCLTLTDYPDFHHRGIMFDIVRNYSPKEEVLRLIDQLALYKMNVLHMHLTDDEGWRLEIPGLPELTEVGSRRGHTTDERECLYPAYNGGWDMNDLNSTANGYLTRQDYIDILRYANERHIRVLPEIDMPGHMRAAIKSMEARYHKYIDTDPAKATEYLLTDFNDTSVYTSAQHYPDNVLCIALPSCYTFIEKVIDEVVAMYAEAEAPLEIFHVGGDEVAKMAWTGSPICQAHMQKMGMENTYDLKDEFIAKVLDILKKHNLQCEGWEEIAMRKGVANPRFADANILSHCWNSVPEWRGDEVPYKLANAGYPVMLGCVTNLYLDMSYLNHEDERALHWGGYTDEYSTFDFQPFDLYRSVRTTMKGEPRDIEAYANGDKTTLLPEAKRNIIGMQAQLFAETIRSTDQVEDYIFPKFFGVAERAWNAYPDFGRINRDGSIKSPESIVQYPVSLNKFNAEITNYDMPWLAARGIHFHLTQPGIHRDGETVYMNAPAAQAEIRYTLDGSDVTADSPLYTEPFQTDAALIRARTFYCGMASNTTNSKQ